VVWFDINLGNVYMFIHYWMLVCTRGGGWWCWIIVMEHVEMMNISIDMLLDYYHSLNSCYLSFNYYYLSFSCYYFVLTNCYLSLNYYTFVILQLLLLLFQTFDLFHNFLSWGCSTCCWSQAKHLFSCFLVIGK
jgi:hypothetical protein